VANQTYNNAKKLIGDGTFDWDAGGQTYKCLLTTSSYTPNIDTHVFVSDVTNELTGGGYVRKTLATRTVTVDNTNDRADYKADNPVWTGLTGSPALLVVYKEVTTDADSPLICVLDIPDQVLTSADFTVKFDAQATNGSVFRVS
jgi:hypothetical protein